MIMHNVYTLTTAKAQLSSIVGEVEFGHQKAFITRKGKNVVVLIPFEEYQQQINEKRKKQTGLMAAKGVLGGFDELDSWVNNIYKAREIEQDRKVSI